ncbi:MULTISPECIES: GNAT family N-acetyltransferase [unclassified Symbiopectobacterium]|uniref:GNAT family N-acetyltransferase n=1 Tax=unclassified Symbiopectobacterium TaxID=2794573 RepID=UPI0022274F82|nr:MULTISPECIES: GNAT family protein [unclassified Symbiopectobacterium]MCW2474213.1 GNAT family N-acetyltransferase [Candidatus Symbiopectobacterium sp. NZEC151]MCW2482299.1 GNAT family N-acetyltransferase [Candidatus Symbiopectobacterium sp. NZEC135]MCW2485449.1 GNAT family N-acetyltransferase [Candidatus Symbiopectobacterium sp. NZEC127]
MTPVLQGSLVTLRPLLHADAQSLVNAAAAGELWSLPFTVVPSADTVDAYIQKALKGQAEGTVMPFAITLSADQSIIGSTRFWKIDRENRKLEIGHTWYSQRWQRTAANTESKLLLLRYAFEQLQCVRVQFTTDVLNERSQAAILRIGAAREGIIRNERIMPDGRKRTSIRYSIIDDEWPQVQERLERSLSSYGQEK